MANVENDALTGTDTTGHEWDGIKELNTPLPKWWLYTFYATILWAIAYTVVYPSWPTLGNYWGGVAGYSSRADHRADMGKLADSRAVWAEKFKGQDIETVANDPELLKYAMAGGAYIFAENCAPCHGAGGQGGKGFPILADDAWIWGGTLADIQQTISYGVRSGHDEARFGEMPSFGADEILSADEISQVATYVNGLSSGTASGPGAQVFADNCAACHGEDGKGIKDMGAPNLADDIWLFGGSVDAITKQINKPQHGVMPVFIDRLGEVSVKQVSIYVHTLGGGQ